MTNVTEEFQQYRLCCREIWNRHVWSADGLPSHLMIARFEALRLPLFELLVCASAGIDSTSQFLVVPSVPSDLAGRQSARITLLLAREDGGLNAGESFRVFSDEVEMKFLEYFEWGNQSYQDLRWIKVLITRFSTQPDLVGHNAIVDAYESDIFAGPPRSHAAPD